MGAIVKQEKFKKQLARFKKIGIDTSCFIYLFEQQPQFEPLCRALFNLAGQGEIGLFTSVISVAEVLVRPKRENDVEMEKAYAAVFQSTPNLEILDLDYPSAQLASDLKAKYNLGLADAFQLAVCLQRKLKTFLTNDKQLQKVKEMRVLVLRNFIQ